MRTTSAIAIITTLSIVIIGCGDDTGTGGSGGADGAGGTPGDGGGGEGVGGGSGGSGPDVAGACSALCDALDPIATELDCAAQDNAVCAADCTEGGMDTVGCEDEFVALIECSTAAVSAAECMCDGSDTVACEVCAAEEGVYLGCLPD